MFEAPGSITEVLEQQEASKPDSGFVAPPELDNVLDQQQSEKEN